MTTTCVDKLCNSSVCWLDSSFSSWTFQILGNPFFCAKPCQIDQNSLFNSISLKFIQNHWVVDVAGYKVSAWHVVLFSVFDVQKRQELPAKLPQKSVKLRKKTSNSRKSRKVIQTFFSGTHLITSLTANRMTNARSLRNSLQLLEFWTLLESL
jgi:hypothetical protein